MNRQNYENPINRSNLSNEVKNLYNSNMPSLNDLTEKYQTGIIGTLMSLYFQLLNTLAKYGIDKTAEFFNLDPNLGTKDSLQQLTTNITQFKDILKSPEGKELLNELSDILVVAIKELEGPINELTNTINQLIDKEITVAQQFLFNEIKIALGPVGATIEIITDAITATANAADATAEATGIFKEQVETFNEIKAKIQLWLEKLKTASKSYQEYQNSSGPGSLIKGFNAAKGTYNLQNSTDEIKGKMNNYASKINNYASNLKSRFSGSTVVPPLDTGQTPMTGGKKIRQTFNHIQKGGKQSAKRTKKSISDFLNSGIKSSQIIKMMEGKAKTRRKRRAKRS
jgi:hypothetical protein